MNNFPDLLRSIGSILVRRSVVLLLGGTIGYAVGYRAADAGEPSLVSRVQSSVGVDNVRDDHMRRQRAIDALRQARMDSIDAQLPH